MIYNYGMSKKSLILSKNEVKMTERIYRNLYPQSHRQTYRKKPQRRMLVVHVKTSLRIVFLSASRGK